MSGDPDTAHVLDVTGETCPMTYVRMRVALDRLEPGEILEVRLRGEEPARSLPLMAGRLGHQVLSFEDGAESALLRVRCVRSSASTSASDPSG